MTRSALAVALVLAAPFLHGGQAEPPRESPPVRSPPSPRDYLGYDPIEEARAVGPDQVAGYLRALAAASRRLRVETIGLSTDGWPIEMALVSSPENLAGGPGRRAPIPVLITCSIHADEVGPALMALRLLHRLLTDRTPGTERILRELLVMVVPSANPDGLALVKDFAGDARGRQGPLPALYQRFTGHDNNRDWILLTQMETRAFTRFHARTRPSLVIDVHQMGHSGPRLFVPPYAGPIHPDIPPRLLARADRLGNEVRSRMERAGRTGIISGSILDAWTPARVYPFFHGASRFLIEVAGADLFRPVKIGRREAAGGEPRVTWGIPEIVAHALEATETALQAVSERPEEWRDEDDRPPPGPAKPPLRRGYFLPAGEADPWAAREVLEALRLGGEEVALSRAGWTVAPPAGGPEGLEGWLRTLLECTPYPPWVGDAVPYDGTCHDLAHLAGLVVERAGVPPDFKPAPGRVEVLPGPFDSRGSKGGEFLMESRSLAVLREVVDLLLEGFEVRRTREGTEAGGRTFPPGSFLVAGAPAAWIERISRETGAAAACAPLKTPLAGRLRLPRVGVCSAASPSMDEGWTRWVLEEFHFPFRSVRDLASGLSGLDVLVVPEETLPPEVKVGIEAFVSKGGRVVALGNAARKLASWMKLPVTQRSSRRPGVVAIRTPGVLLRARRTAAGESHPLLDGLGSEVPLYFTDGPFWDLVPERGAGAVRPLALLEFPETGALLCGSLQDEDSLAGASPLVEVRWGRGEVLLVGFRPQFRGWTLGSLRILLNALFREVEG